MDYFEQSDKLIKKMLNEVCSSVTEDWNTIILTITKKSKKGEPMVIDGKLQYVFNDNVKNVSVPDAILIDSMQLINITSSEKGDVSKITINVKNNGDDDISFDLKYEY